MGDYIGSFLEYDSRNSVSSWKEFMRLRVRIDIRHPLKKSKKIKLQGDAWAVVLFKYECLTIFCFVCGRLGHMDRFCPLLIQFHEAKKEVVKSWSVEIRVPMRRAVMSGDRRWLRDGSGGNIVEVEEDVNGSGDGLPIGESNVPYVTMHGKGDADGSLFAINSVDHVSGGGSCRKEGAINVLDITMCEDRKRKRAEATAQAQVRAKAQVKAMEVDLVQTQGVESFERGGSSIVHGSDVLVDELSAGHDLLARRAQ